MWEESEKVLSEDETLKIKTHNFTFRHAKTVFCGNLSCNFLQEQALIINATNFERYFLALGTFKTR